MLQYFVWVISFISLYIAIIWITFIYINLGEKQKQLKYFPKVTIAIPAYNEEKGIATTIKSVLNLDYPKKKLEIIIVNDGSKDRTKEAARSAIKNTRNVKLISQKNSGKAAALNTALKYATGEFFACVDADSTVCKSSLALMLIHFEDKKVGAVISALRVKNKRNVFERIQRLEYIIAVLSRKLRALIKTLDMTPGVLSVYRTSVLKKLGGFDENNNPTEDFEIALRLKYNGYNINIEPEAVTYTAVPSTLRVFWRQRIRWYRGFIFNHLKYREMFFNNKYSLLGYFQLPLNIAGIMMLLTGITIATYYIMGRLFEFIIRVATIDGYIMNHLFYMPSLKDLILSHNTKLMLPIYIASVASFFLFYSAHKQTKQRIRYPFTILTYFVVYPYIVATEWVTAITQEFTKSKRKW